MNKTVDDMLRLTYDYESKTLGLKVSLPVRVYYPSSYTKDDDKKYPLMLFYHGYGEIGKDNEKQIRVLQKPNKLLDMLVETDECIIVAPQCYDPSEYNWVGLNHVWGTGARKELDTPPTISMEASFKLLDEFLESGKVDKNRVYVSGISMGGYACWEALARRPETFACAVPLCGGGILSSAQSLKDTPIWAFHGIIDGTVPVSGSVDMIEELKKCGSVVCKGTYFEGVGHDVWNHAYRTEGLVDWILAQHK